MSIDKPPEPRKATLAERIDTDGLDSYFDVQTGRDWRLKKAVPSYLWSDHWSESLRAKGISWAEFQSAAPSGTIGRWADGDETWEDVLKKYAERLGIQLRGSE